MENNNKKKYQRAAVQVQKVRKFYGKKIINAVIVIINAAETYVNEF
jgi:hypothetical protein